MWCRPRNSSVGLRYNVSCVDVLMQVVMYSASCNVQCDVFYLHEPHHSAQRPKTSLGVLGDEPCRLNGTTEALSEPVEVNHLRRTIHRVPGGSHSPRPTRRLNPPTSAVGLASLGMSDGCQHLLSDLRLIFRMECIC